MSCEARRALHRAPLPPAGRGPRQGYRYVRNNSGTRKMALRRRIVPKSKSSNWPIWGSTWLPAFRKPTRKGGGHKVLQGGFCLVLKLRRLLHDLLDHQAQLHLCFQPTLGGGLCWGGGYQHVGGPWGADDKSVFDVFCCGGFSGLPGEGGNCWQAPIECTSRWPWTSASVLGCVTKVPWHGLNDRTVRCNIFVCIFF
jgi:hypothetical protein